MRRSLILASLLSTSVVAPVLVAGCVPRGTQFAAVTRFHPGRSPVAGGLVDLNGDGKADLIIGRQESHGLVGIQLGNGDGSFQPPMQIIGTNAPRASFNADLNGDGKPDLIFAGLVEGAVVSVFINLGDGHFDGPRNFPCGRTPSSMRVADLNGDGKADIVLANQRPDEGETVSVIQGNLTILSGNGDGTFQAPRSWVIGTDPRGLAVGDWNGDGKVDLAIGDDLAHKLTILLNEGDATFKEHASYEMLFGVRGLHVADFNHDGKADLAVRHTGVTVLLGNGDGSFLKTTTQVTDTTESLAIADFDGDGNPDIASQRRVLFGDGAGEFKRVIEFDPLNREGFVTSGDLNGDGAIDLVVIDKFYNRVSVYLNQSGQGGAKAVSMAKVEP